MPGLEDLYREIILDHYRNPRNRGELPAPPAHRSEGFNPLCGDEVQVYLDVEDGTVADVKVSGQGCSISQSSASARRHVRRCICTTTKPTSMRWETDWKRPPGSSDSVA